MKSKRVFRVTAPAAAKVCECGKCAKVKYILASPLGPAYTEQQLRAMGRGELVDLAGCALLATPPARPRPKPKPTITEAEAWRRARSAVTLPRGISRALGKRISGPPEKSARRPGSLPRGISRALGKPISPGAAEDLAEELAEWVSTILAHPQFSTYAERDLLERPHEEIKAWAERVRSGAYDGVLDARRAYTKGLAAVRRTA